MATIRPFQLFDLLEYNNINLDILTETVNIFYYKFKIKKKKTQKSNLLKFDTLFYGKYIAKWPEYCITQINCTGKF